MKKHDWVIECPNRCHGKGCHHDGDGREWRPSARVRSATWWEARRVMKRHAKACWKSGPYRLRRMK